jgi:AmiR/NasT family two-component response regulator
MASWEDQLYRVAQAQGMVSVQAGCNLNDAITMMHERALVQHQSLNDIAKAVIDRSIRFGP